MAAVDEVREALERTVPDFSSRSGDWAGVLAEARASEVSRPRWLMWPAVGAAAVAIAAALVLFWPGGRGSGSILDRALAAVGTDPIIHVVIEAPPVDVYDLGRDEYGSVPVVVEQWFLPEKGIHEVRTVGSQVVGDMALPYKPADFPEGQEQYAGVATAYRRALAADEASLGPEETVDGRRVHWIRFSVSWFGGASQYEVAVDAETFEPRFLRVDGGRIETVRTFETLPLGEGDFGPRDRSVPPPLRSSDDDPRWSGTSRVGAQSPAEARDTLRGALWLDERFWDLPLASIRETRYENRAPEGFWPRSARALELCYGSDERCAVVMTEATVGYSLVSRHAWPFEPPPGTLAFGDAPGVGFVIRDGIHVVLSARNRDELIAAAKALTPIP